jgi:drug/metabolite transporter (DMT)-like permease
MRRIVVSLVAVYLIWGSTYYGLRVALEALPPFLLAGSRFLVAGAVLLMVARLRGAKWPDRRQLGGASLIGFLLLVVGNGGVTYAEQSVSSSLAAVVVATMPVLAMALSLLMDGRSARPGPLQVGGLVVGFAGVALLHAGGELRSHGAAALVLALSPVSWAVGSLLSLRVPLPEGAMGTAIEMIAGGVMMLGIAAARGEAVDHVPSGQALFAWAYLVVFGSLVAFSAYTYLLKKTRPAVSTSYAFVNPVVALVLGVAVGGEEVRPLTWLAAGVTVSGVAALTLGRRRAAV